MKNLLALIAFSVLLLVPVSQNVFADHPQKLGCPAPFGESATLVPDGAIRNSPDINKPYCEFDPVPAGFTDFHACESYTQVSIFGGGSSGDLSYLTCAAPAILVDDITHPDQCQGAAVLLSNHCFAEIMAMIGGVLLSIDKTALLVGAIGTDPVITGLVALTMAGIAGQTAWFIHRRKKKILN